MTIEYNMCPNNKTLKVLFDIKDVVSLQYNSTAQQNLYQKCDLPKLLFDEFFIAWIVVALDFFVMTWLLMMVHKQNFFYFRFHKFSTNQKCNCRSEELFIAYLESTTQSLAICYFRNIFCYFQIYLHLILQQQRWQRRIGWPSFVLISYTTFLFS